MWKQIKDTTTTIVSGVVMVAIMLAVGWAARSLNEIIEAPTYTLSVFNCYTKPCEWIQGRGVYDKRAECERMGKQLLDKIDHVKDYKCEE
jgi:hypothetical protein